MHGTRTPSAARRNFHLACLVMTAVLAACGGSDQPKSANGDAKAAPDTSSKTEGLMGMDTSFVNGTMTIGGYLTRPAGEAALPAVILIHEWWGLNEQVKKTSDRLAREGYVVLAPDLYHGKVAQDPEGAHELMRGLPEDRAVSDARAAAAKIRSLPGMASTKIGIVGFCMGGRIALLSSMGAKDFSACAVFYGRPETDSAKLQGLCPVLGVFGGADQGIGPDQVDPFRDALTKA